MSRDTPIAAEEAAVSAMFAALGVEVADPYDAIRRELALARMRAVAALP